MVPDTSTPAAASPSAERPGRSREHWFLLAAAALTVLGLVVMGLLLTPDARGVGTHKQLGLRPCMTMEYWNFPCPGCGVTTSVTLATQGEFLQSFKNQPFGFLVFLTMLGFVGWVAVGQVRGRDLWRDLQSRRWGKALVVLAFVCALSWLYKIWLIHG